MTQQTEMFIRNAMLGEIPMAPNANGLFTVDQVAVLASKRGCVTHKAGDYGVEIQYRRKPSASIMATDKGLWHPVNIFRACREAVGQPHYEIDYAKAKIKNPGGLNEVLIAQIVGADGVRPYLSRPGKYEVGINERDGRLIWNHPNVLDGNDFLIYDVPKAIVGGWTWPMFNLFQPSMNSGKSYDYRRAVRTLDDAGLLKLTVGPRGGFGTATFEWLPAAYLAVEAPKLDHADAEFLSDLMSVS
jgi:hypothetical protein